MTAPHLLSFEGFNSNVLMSINLLYNVCVCGCDKVCVQIVSPLFCFVHTPVFGLTFIA